MLKSTRFIRYQVEKVFIHALKQITNIRHQGISLFKNTLFPLHS